MQQWHPRLCFGSYYHSFHRLLLRQLLPFYAFYSSLFVAALVCVAYCIDRTCCCSGCCCCCCWQTRGVILFRQGNLVQLEVDAIVNSTNESLSDRSGLCGDIFRCAGPELATEVAKLEGCRTGESKPTKGYSLPARYADSSHLRLPFSLLNLLVGMSCH
jgi:hypothetical protein